MIALYLAPVYIVINGFLLWKFIKWTHTLHNVMEEKPIIVGVISIYVLLATAVLTGFLLPRCGIQRLLRLIGNYWLGFLLITIMVVAVYKIITFFLGIISGKPRRFKTREAFRRGGMICIALIVALCVYGGINAREIQITRYTIDVDKACKTADELKIVLVADIHLGYNIGCEQVQTLVQKINDEKPDLVVIAGDIFDNQYEALDNPERLAKIFRGISSKYGVYGVYGNHDVEEKILAGFTFDSGGEKGYSKAMADFLSKAGIEMLVDQGILVDESFYLYGRPDYSHPGVKTPPMTPSEITKGMDKSKPIIVVDHQPHQLEELATAGVDVDLSGHTHDGQLFPANILVGMIWENSYGHVKVNNMHSLVTSGAGIFGPYMRIGTKSEICSIKVKFSR